MGYEIAEEARRRGADVVLISGPASIVSPSKVEFIKIQTAEEMEKEVKKHFAKANVVIMAAAISDFKFADIFPEKIKKQELADKIQLVQTGDVLKSLGQKKGRKILVGFAAETENIVNNALKKIREKNLDLIVANNVLEEGIGFESDFNQVSIIYPDGRTIQTEKKSKLEISQIILDKIEEIIGERS